MILKQLNLEFIQEDFWEITITLQASGDYVYQLFDKNEVELDSFVGKIVVVRIVPKYQEGTKLYTLEEAESIINKQIECGVRKLYDVKVGEDTREEASKGE